MSLWLASRCLASLKLRGEVSARSKCSRAAAKSPLRQGGAAQRQMGANMLAQRPAFAAFPRLKLAGSRRVAAPWWAGRSDCKARKVPRSSHRVAGPDRDVFPARAGVSPAFHRAASKAGRARKAAARRPGWPGTPGRKPARALAGCSANVEIADAEVAPDDGETPDRASRCVPTAESLPRGGGGRKADCRDNRARGRRCGFARMAASRMAISSSRAGKQ